MSTTSPPAESVAPTISRYPVAENMFALVDAASQVVVDAGQMADLVGTSTDDEWVSAVAEEILMFDLDGVDDQRVDAMSSLDKLHTEVILSKIVKIFSFFL